SADGAIEELPLLRPSRRRSSRTSAASATTSALSSPIAAVCSAITASRAAHDAQPAAGGGRTAITGHHHHRRPVINAPRQAGNRKIASRSAQRATSPDSSRAGSEDVNVYPSVRDRTTFCQGEFP